MTSSMTGYGRSKMEENGIELSVEIKTLNHRYLDVNIRLPRSLSFIEETIRKIIQKHIFRGRVEVQIGYNNKSEDLMGIEINESLIAGYIKCFHDIAYKYGITNNISISDLLSLSDIFQITEKDEDEGKLIELAVKAVEQAVDVLINMRRAEGKELVKDIRDRISIIHNKLKFIEERAPLVVEEYSIKLRNRLKELLKTTELDESRFVTEVVYFADRSNITEEIIRLYSHMEQLINTVESTGAVGRKLDFIVQEMNREANTIGSKASDLMIVNSVVEMKSEIEKIREQIQNIE